MKEKIEIPEKALVLMIGIAGVGKSTLARKAFGENSIIVSSDECRKEISGDEADQSVSKQAFELFHEKIRKGLKEGRRRSADATNVSYLGRKALYEIAKENDAPVYALMFNIPLEVAKRQNKNRDRVVPEFVLEKQFEQMKRAYREIEEELPKGNIIDIAVPVREHNRSETREELDNPDFRKKTRKNNKEDMEI